MIFQKLPMEKKSALTSSLSLLLVLHASLMLSPILEAAQIEIGIASEVTSFTVEQLNAPGTGTPQPSSEQTTPVAVPGTTVAPVSEPTEELSQRKPHIFTRPQAVEPLNPRPNATVEQVLQTQGTSQTQTLSGKGSKELVALADGEVSLEVYLYTYSPADIVVRLYDEDGNEIRFDGQPLLSWRRVDGSSYAPVKFKGAVDSSSMFEESTGDYSPTPGISYKVDVKRGQKIVLTTSGGAEPRSYVKATGAVF